MTRQDASNAFIRYWQLVAVLIALGVSWGTNQNQLQVLAEEVNNNEEKIEEVKALERVVIEVKVNQENAKEDIKEIKDSISKILEKLDER